MDVDPEHAIENATTYESLARAASSDTARRARSVAATALLAVACLQMVGYIAGSRALRGLGAATVMSPMPKVFSDVDGLEPYASEFVLNYRESGGSGTEVPITPALYGRLAGPYNRRNVYGAALSYGLRLPDTLWKPVFCYGLAPDGPLRHELGISKEAVELSVTIRTRTGGRDDSWTLAPRCGW